MDTATTNAGRATPWNIGQLLGQKPPLKPKEIWAIRIRLTRGAVGAWIAPAHLNTDQFLFPSRMSASPHRSTRQHSRIVGAWVGSIGLDPAAYGTHSMRRTKPTLISRRTRNLRAVQPLPGHSKLDYLPRRTMSRVTHSHQWPAMHFAEHRRPHYKPLRNGPQPVIGPVPPGLTLRWRRLVGDRLLHCQVGVQIDLRRLQSMDFST